MSKQSILAATYALSAFADQLMVDMPTPMPSLATPDFSRGRSRKREQTKKFHDPAKARKKNKAARKARRNNRKK